MESKQDNLDLAESMNSSLSNGDAQADILAEQLDITPEGANKTRETIGAFIRSYRDKSPEQSNQEWLSNEFAKYPEIWSSDAEREAASTDIVAQVELYESSKRELAEHHAKGLSTNNWLAKKIEQGAETAGVANVGAYATKIETVIDLANEANRNLIRNNDGQLNQQWNLDGYIAEQHHVDTFNLDAAAKGSDLRAEVLKPKPGEAYGKNSVDIVIRDKNGKIVRRYQAKYGADADTTEKMFKKGDYRGQRKLVPKGQADEVEGSVDTIEMDDVQSKPLSKEEAKERQRKAQEEAEAKEYDWNELSRGDIAKNIGKKAGIAALSSVAFQGARILGRRIWNGLTGKQNNSVKEDLEEFVQTSLRSAAGAGLAVAVTGGVTVAVKNGWLGAVIQNTPVGRVANAVCIGLENIKILWKLGTGEITGPEALDQAGNVTCSMLGGLYGASVGTILGPLGTFLGGIAGGIVGGMAGSTVGEAIYEGGKRIVKGAVNAVKIVCSSVASGARAVYDFFFS